MLLNFFANLLLVSFLLSPHFGLVTTGNFLDDGVIGPQKKVSQSLGLVTSATSALVIDRKTKKVLWSKNPDTVGPVASLTKLMTALVFLDNNPGWDETVLINSQDQLNGGRVYIVPGDTISIKDLFNLTLIASSNEAAAALARSTGLSSEEFVSQMNERAQLLGLEDTKFVEPSGLDPNNVSTAADIAKLLNHAFSVDEIIETNQREEYIFTPVGSKISRAAQATNLLLNSFVNEGEYKISGAKTGFIDESGYNLAMSVSKVDSSGEIILVLLGSETIESRWQDAKGLVDWTFHEYKWSDD
ncbi:MAG: hypothetical protein COT81_01490 [Candidatus Buchananbacteria bacterium CG10_big_fil_rev_8_21_14_0_10_42_9]|uniref:Peptidase S11 D-alanyl-D-alanine carboxypeptidase A N-terminal domain-containing protein n=1 Tax=Candidatus Buchananbacteria bacterium CG10_big_fil_rev_8_21_14_0_10_42_9 TaxID=1974526 RepID=A0A2H0W232_9BACT|nr:MAG: hypothetical protein COT81_01490 [Candidatus Buchananbacteria bacterium CG10_big_fil_rev_8_21_14_0_10_42_9]